MKSWAYEELLTDVFILGTEKGDRTGTGTSSLFGTRLEYDLSRGFPLITTKKVNFRAVVGELIWFLSGNTNIKYLNDNGINIWNEWADSDGQLGPVYGHQWRSWPGRDGSKIDQIAEVIEGIRSDPDSRRHLVSAWNPADLSRMALPPCHVMFQFYVDGGKLSCQLYQRSADMFLGVPFNIASYALLTHMVAQQCNLEVGDFIWVGGDTHIYNNHREQVREQIKRLPYDMPTIEIRKRDSLFDYQIEDVTLLNYDHHPAITGKVSV